LLLRQVPAGARIALGQAGLGRVTQRHDAEVRRGERFITVKRDARKLFANPVS
jgi:hypothetical protein